MNTGLVRRAAVARIVKFIGALGERQVRVTCSSEEVDRVGDIVVQNGIDLSQYRRNPVVLWQHDAAQPIARAIEIGVENGRLTALVQFPPEGTSETSDLIYRLVKQDVVCATSIGFLPLEWEPIDGEDRWGGLRYQRTELLEFSFVSVPANPSALVTSKSLGLRDHDEDDLRAEALRRIRAYRDGMRRRPTITESEAIDDRRLAEAREKAAPMIAAAESSEALARASYARSVLRRW